MAEQKVGTEQDDLIGIECGSAMIKQIGDSLQNGGSLTGSCHPLNQQQIAFGITNNIILFFLDRCHDILHVLVVLMA